MLHSARGGLQWYALATYLLDIGNITRIKTLLRFMCFLTCAIESLGMIFFKILSYCYDSQASLFDCLFQSVNFFSNAGFVFSDHPLYAVTFSLGGLAISSILILLGSLGFLCMLELKEFYDAKKNGGIYIFSVTSKTAFIIYGLTLLLAAVLCYFFVVSDGSLFYRLIKALFYALSMRSCGFIEVSLISKFSEIGLCLLSLYSFLGGVPFSTTSGIKSSVMGIIFATGKSILNAARSVSLFGRSIALECVVKANFYLIYLGFLTYFLSSLLFLLSSSTFSYGQSFLSIGSVLSNTGMLCVNILHADPLMKCILMLGMCIGRLGMLIFILRFSYASQTSIEYPQEKLILV